MDPKDNRNKQTDPGADFEEPYNNRRLEDWIKIAFWIAVVVAAGMIAVNQTLGFFYKAEFLKTPCQLCGELNPGVSDCIENYNSPRASYPDGLGGWTDPFKENNLTIPS